MDFDKCLFLTNLSHETVKQMDRIQVKVEEVIDGCPDDAFDAMIRFDTYHSWWPSSMPVKCVHFEESYVGNKLLIKPYPLVKIGWSIHSFTTSREIIIHYYQGMHEGVGVWTFTDLENDKVAVSFEIDIMPKGKIYNGMYRLFGVEKIHIEQVKKLIGALAIRIKKPTNHAH